MFLREIRIHKFRGITEERVFSCNSFNVIVGKNDVGKSTILKALDYFLNDTKPTFDEINNASGDYDFIIELLFNPGEQPIIIDGNIPTTFEQEELLNENGFLHIKRKWTINTPTSKPSLEWYIERKKYSENDFILKTEPQLLSLCRELDIETHKANSDEYNNVEKREKLRSYFAEHGIGSTYDEERLSTTGTSRSKIIYDQIKKILPTFEYFRADTSLSDSDTSIQKYFREKAHNALVEYGKEDLEEAIDGCLRSVLESIANKVNKVVPSEESVTPIVKFDWSKIITTLFETNNDEGDLPLSQRGDGFRRIVMMAYFESLAEENNEGVKQIIFGFEEPETFLHPSSQELLFKKIQGMSENDYQVFITSHSPVIVANSNIKDLSLITKDEGYCIEYPIEHIDVIIEDLGITADNQFFVGHANAFLLVEGRDDVIALKHIADEYKKADEIRLSFDDLGVGIIPLGNSNSIMHWKNLGVLKTLNRPYLIYHDSDKKTEDQTSPTMTNLNNWGFVEGTDFFVSRKREMENYILPCALTRITGIDVSYGDWDDVKLYCNKHPEYNKLGGKGVLLNHFQSVQYDELKQAFCCNGDDEFLLVYNTLVSKLS